MTQDLFLLSVRFAGLAGAARPSAFQTHYIRLGARNTSVAIAAEGQGNMFIVSDGGFAA